ncbi:hypothetical protein GCM10009413_28570 [Tatumella punctata]
MIKCTILLRRGIIVQIYGRGINRTILRIKNKMLINKLAKSCVIKPVSSESKILFIFIEFCRRKNDVFIKIQKVPIVISNKRKLQ